MSKNKYYQKYLEEDIDTWKSLEVAGLPIKSKYNEKE